MRDLREQLQAILQGRVCLVGVGNVEQGDDGVGVRLAAALAERGARNAECGEAEPEDRNLEAEGAPQPGIRMGAPGVGRSGLGCGAWDLGLEVVVTGTAPDRYTRQLRDAGFDTVLFLDAVEFGAAPGSVALFNSGEMRARFPQVSTHKLSLGLLAQLIEANGRTRVWLLGVQPGSLAAGSVLSEAVENTQGLLVGLFPGIGTLPVHSTRHPVDKGDRPEACSTDPEAGEWRDGEERRQASAFSPLPSALPC